MKNRLLAGGLASALGLFPITAFAQPKAGDLVLQTGFEEDGWDWSYHAFREWNGWSVEHGPDRQETSPSQTQTSREKLLRSWFERNARPK